MTGLKYIGIALILAVVAAFIALDLNPLDDNGPGLALFSTANMCTDPELKEYVFWPFSCDEFNQIKVVDFGGAGPISSPEKIHELNRNTDIVHIGQ